VDVAVTLFALGASLGLFHPANTSSVMNAAAKEHLGTASGFVSTLRMLGQFVGMSMSAEVLGVYLIGLGGLEALNATVAPAVHQQILEAYLSGQALAFRLAAIVLIVGALLAAARGAQAAPAVVAADAQPARP